MKQSVKIKVSVHREDNVFILLFIFSGEQSEKFWCVYFGHISILVSILVKND